MLSSVLSLAALALAGIAQAASTCNGHSELCSYKYSDVVFLGAHDSYSVGSSIANNQDKNVTQQLNDGIRTLQLQTHNASDGLHLCHSSCSFVDAGLLSTYLSSVAEWVEANPNEVVTIVLVNIDSQPVSEFAAAFETAGLKSKVWSPSWQTISISDFPTLGTLIDAGTPVVVFMDFGADFSTIPWIIDEFINMWEDAYDVTNTGWDCTVNRTSGDTSTQLIMVNHFLDSTYTLAGNTLFVPKKSALNTTNSNSSISTHVGNCQSLYGRKPNHILLDYYDSNGNEPFNLVASLNGVSSPTNAVTYGSSSTSTSTGSSSSVSMTVVHSNSRKSLSLSGQGTIVLGAVAMATILGCLRIIA